MTHVNGVNIYCHRQKPLSLFTRSIFDKVLHNKTTRVLQKHNAQCHENRFERGGDM